MILLHPRGVSDGGNKDMPRDMALDLAMELLTHTDGSLVFLEPDCQVSYFAGARTRHLGQDWGPSSLADLLELIAQSDLLIGVDSGPLHLARLTRTPSLGVWFRHHPVSFALPRARQANVFFSDAHAGATIAGREELHIVRAGGLEGLVRVALRMLEGGRYLDDAQIGADVLLRSYVDMCNGGLDSRHAAFVDRHRGNDLLLRLLRKRFDKPTVVETGCIREAEDWPGAGMFGYLAGAFLSRHGGRLVSVDSDPGKCQFARDYTAAFSGIVQVVNADSVDFLSGFPGRIDLLYLDSLDSGEPGSAEHNLNEAKAAVDKLGPKSLVAVDDTTFGHGGWSGKGALTVPYLLSTGWQAAYSGHQTALVRTEP